MSTTQPQRALILGCGSIGLRHAIILKNMGFNIGFVTKRKDIDFKKFDNIKIAILQFKPSVVVISSPTSEHRDNYLELIESHYSGKVLIEKPIFNDPGYTELNSALKIFVGYNLRFHPIIKKIRELLSGHKIFSIQFSVGQYLPTWRTNIDYTKCYSSNSLKGGGVLRDLSHELDLALLLGGEWEKVAARIGKFGNLNISSEDTVDIIGQFTDCKAVNIHLDYNSLIPQRKVIVHADKISIYADIISGILKTQDKTFTYSLDKNETYIAQWKDILSHGASTCIWEEGIRVMHLIAAIENAAEKEIWVRNC